MDNNMKKACLKLLLVGEIELKYYSKLGYKVVFCVNLGW